MFCLTTIGLLLTITGCNRADMQYVVPKSGENMEHSVFRALSLSESKPDDLKETAHYRGNSRRYAEFRYGSPSSKPVTVVLDMVSEGQTDVYVDRDRNRMIEDKDRIETSGAIQHLLLDVEIGDGSAVKHFPRMVVFRLGRSGQSISYTTAGYMEGRVKIGGQDTTVRIVDNNSDGLINDADDLVWIDINHDGKWEPFSERLPFTPITNVQTDRYALKSNLTGESFSLKKIEGTGTLELTLPQFKDKSLLSALTVWLTGHEGSIIKLDLEHLKMELPVGEYYIYEITMDMADPDGGDQWTYFFSPQQVGEKSIWYSVTANNNTVINPLGNIVLKATLSNSGPNCKPGEEISVEPVLDTGENIYLRLCCRNYYKSDDSKRLHDADIKLTDQDGKVLDTAKSGFR